MSTYIFLQLKPAFEKVQGAGLTTKPLVDGIILLITFCLTSYTHSGELKVKMVQGCNG